MLSQMPMVTCGASATGCIKFVCAGAGELVGYCINKKYAFSELHRQRLSRSVVSTNQLPDPSEPMSRKSGNLFFLYGRQVQWSYRHQWIHFVDYRTRFGRFRPLVTLRPSHLPAHHICQKYPNLNLT